MMTAQFVYLELFYLLKKVIVSKLNRTMVGGPTPLVNYCVSFSHVDFKHKNLIREQASY